MGTRETTELTENKLLQQCQIVPRRGPPADEFGCAAIGIISARGIKDLAPAKRSRLKACSTTSIRPPVKCPRTGAFCSRGGRAAFNEVDEMRRAGWPRHDRLWRELGFAPENTLHDLRWAGTFREAAVNDYVWVFLISGAAPPRPAHFIGG